MQEYIVGSIAFTGGGVATPLPILGFMLLWLNTKGNFTRKDWLYLVLLIFIGVVSYKRAIWFVMPIIVFFFMVYVPKRKILKKILWVLPLVPLVFYFGVRLNPTLNKEKQVWGSFDLDYAINYASAYSFGENRKDHSKDNLAEGRGGATMLLLGKMIAEKELAWNDIFGYGLEEITTRDYDNFDQEKFGVNSKGAVTGIFRDYISFGFVGVAAMLFYILSILSCIKERRIRNVMIGFVLWEYFFYSGLLLQTQALTILLFYFIIYSNVQKDRGGFLRFGRRVKLPQVQENNNAVAT